MLMQEDKKIVIQLPRLDRGFFLNLRFGIALAIVLFAGLFGYWHFSIRPYLWISGAHVEAFSAIISSDTPGRIAEMGPQEGDLVQKGQMLLSLDRDFLLTKQEQAKRSLHSLNEQVEMEKERFGKALENYLSATGELEIGLGSQEKVKRHLDVMEESQQKSDAIFTHLAAVQDTLADLDLQMKKMTFAAPFDGIVLKRAKQPSSAVCLGEPVYVLCDPSRLWIEAEIPEKEIGRIAVGAPVLVRLPAYPKKEFTGKVSWIGPATVAKRASLPFLGQNEAVPIRITLENPSISLKPGLSAHVRLKVR
jgi:multidrug resistance efflux pump